MEAVQFKPIALAALAAGGIVFSGAMYALCYAFWRQRAEPRFLRCAVTSYLALLVAVGVLQQQLDLSGIWIALIACLLVSYLVAPVLIWRLSAATHVSSHVDNESVGAGQ